MTTNRAKTLKIVFGDLALFGFVAWQMFSNTVCEGGGRATQILSAQDGWPTLVYEGGVGLVILGVLIYWLVTDQFPLDVDNKRKPKR